VSFAGQFFMSLRYYVVETISQSLSQKFLILDFFYFFRQRFVIEGVQDPFLKVSPIKMKIQGFCLNRFNTIQKVFIGRCAYTRVVSDVNIEVKRRDMFDLAVIHEVYLHLVFLIVEDPLVDMGYEKEINIQTAYALHA